MFANDFAEHLAVIASAAEIAAVDSEHGAARPGSPSDGIAPAWATVKDTGPHRVWRAGHEALDRASRDEHDVGFGMVGAEVGVFNGGASEFGEGDDDDVVPRGLVRVEGKVFLEGIHGPTEPTIQIRVRPRESALLAVGVKAAVLGAGDQGIGLIENDGRSFDAL